MPPGEGQRLACLNAIADAQDLRNAQGKAIRFVHSASAVRNYESRVFETGEIPTRPGLAHDLFNALAWLGFPRTKSLINALHMRHLDPAQAREGRRGRVRDLLTLIDEGGVIAQCDDRELISDLDQRRWKDLFWHRRDRLLGRMRLFVIGHALLEKALAPWPAIACKLIVVPPQAFPDEACASWLSGLEAGAGPQVLPSVPIFGFPGWHPSTGSPSFYDDVRVFRPGDSTQHASGEQDARSTR